MLTAVKANVPIAVAIMAEFLSKKFWRCLFNSKVILFSSSIPSKIRRRSFSESSSESSCKKRASRVCCKKSTIRTGKGVVNIVTGHPERLGAGMAAGYGMYQLAKKTGVNRIIMANAKNTFSSIKDQYYRRKGYEFLKRTGL